MEKIIEKAKYRRQEVKYEKTTLGKGKLFNRIYTPEWQNYCQTLYIQRWIEIFVIHFKKRAHPGSSFALGSLQYLPMLISYNTRVVVDNYFMIQGKSPICSLECFSMCCVNLNYGDIHCCLCTMPSDISNHVQHYLQSTDYGHSLIIVLSGKDCMCIVNILINK